MSLRTFLIQKIIAVNENLVFYPPLRKFYRKALKGRKINVLDVGSNKGQSIDFFKSVDADATIVGFEPNPKLYRKLEKKYTNLSSVKLVNRGVSSHSGKLLFQENVLDETSTFEPLNYDSAYLKKKAATLGVSPEGLIVDKYEVEVVSLGEYLSAHHSPAIDVLKIDVEGHELKVLQGLFSGNAAPNVEYIQLESHNDDMYASSGSPDIANLLKERGYSEAARFKHGFGDFWEIIYRKNQRP